jgi:hypothetical protein
MSRSTKSFAPASLLKCFDPPDEFTGEVGWLCGYSADASFLDAAVQRFTLENAAQRAYLGRVALLALLDPGQPQIRPHEAPGVLHAPLRNAVNKPFALLHAKVALLLFRHQSQAERWSLRLVVSTGNWTRQTLEESLDLVWTTELGGDQWKVTGEYCLQARADIHAAWDMMQWLVGLFDVDAITSMPNSRSALSYERMLLACAAITAPPKTSARFFDSRRGGLLGQLPALVRRHAGPVRRNSIFLGSGFYEGSVDEGQVPSVLTKILHTLQAAEAGPLLSSSATVYVTAERTGCQAVAQGLSAMKALGWKVGPPSQPAYLGSIARSLHAKFIMSTNYLSRANGRCVSTWIYLGSGNLTHPGFINRMSPAGGNLEAGVVFADESLTWYVKPNSPEDWVQNRLPIQYDQEFGEKGVPFPIAGGDMPERPCAFIAAPVAWCRFQAQPNPSRLVLPAIESTAVTVLDAEGQPCDIISPTEVSWPAAAPRSVQVRWRERGELKSAFIPVLDAAGRVAGTSLPPLDMEGAWWQLESFPHAPPPEEDTGIAPTQEYEQPTRTSVTPQVARERETAVRLMMRLVENIANKQTTLSEADWPVWCASLQQTLLQAKDSPAVKAFALWQLNPLSPLREAPFRPWFAEGPKTSHSERYEQALDLVEDAWGVNHCEPIAVELSK